MKPQNVTGGPGNHAIFMVFGLCEGQDATSQIKGLCGVFSALVRSIRNRLPDADASGVLGFGAEAWGKLFPNQPRPLELEPFQEIRGKKWTAPATPGDIFVHLRSKRMDVCYELAALVSEAISEATYVIDEVHGFRYFDGRAIIGFVDGTENPEDDERTSFACIADEDPSFNGGSYAFVQKYLHDMKAWNALPTEEQEKVIGRRKYNDVELSDAEKPRNAHNAVTNITGPDGTERKIVRANMPFANPARGEYGTYFIGYARKFSTTRAMLENMFAGDHDGHTDRLLEFSTAVTGTLFFIPSWDLLEALGEE